MKALLKTHKSKFKTNQHLRLNPRYFDSFSIYTPFVLRTTGIVCVLYLLGYLAVIKNVWTVQFAPNYIRHTPRRRPCRLCHLLSIQTISYHENDVSSCCEYFLMTREQSYRNYPIWFGIGTNLLLLAQRRFIEEDSWVELFWPSTELALNWRKLEHNTLQRKKNTKEIIINHKGTRMVKDGEDWHGSQMTNLKNSG